MKKEPLKAELIEKQTLSVAENILTLTISTPAEMTQATELLSQINRQSDAITKEKEKVTKPLNQALAAERKRWKSAEDLIKKSVAHLRSQMSIYQTAQTEIADSEKNKVIGRIGIGKGKLKIETAAQKLNEITGPESKVEAESGSISFKDDYEVTVVNAQQVPVEFLEVDITGIKRALKDGVDVPGITFKVIKVPINRRN